ncbi:hypothetical protein GCM10027347_44520 [Larkinella harenae]
MPQQQYTIDQEIQCLIREIGLRKSVYPKRIESGKLKQESADYEIAVMESALNRLKALRFLMSNLLQ